MLIQLILFYLLIKLFYGTDKIDNAFIKSGKFLFNKTYPVFKTSDYFNTPTLRIKWWNNLNSEWISIVSMIKKIHLHCENYSSALQLLIDFNSS